jgi:hypothetical protein
MQHLPIWEKISKQLTESCHLAGLMFSTVAAQSSHTTSKCSITQLRSLAEVASLNPALELVFHFLLTLINHLII